ncbi:hypothetical protein C5S53_01680 [Methanophagales archaeon]|nr:hypothetical protein C5S53_01680 [Methanophagales archaeon]
MFNSSCCNYSADTVSSAVITVSTLGFFILFSVVPFVGARLEEYARVSPEELIRQKLQTYSYRFLVHSFESESIGRFMLVSICYLLALFVCLLNYLINSIYDGYILLIGSLFLVLIATGISLYTIFTALYKAIIKSKDIKDLEGYIAQTKWLHGKKNS